jgi:hypothetical protein
LEELRAEVKAVEKQIAEMVGCLEQLVHDHKTEWNTGGQSSVRLAPRPHSIGDVELGERAARSSEISENLQELMEELANATLQACNHEAKRRKEKAKLKGRCVPDSLALGVPPTCLGSHRFRSSMDVLDNADNLVRAAALETLTALADENFALRSLVAQQRLLVLHLMGHSRRDKITTFSQTRKQLRDQSSQGGFPGPVMDDLEKLAKATSEWQRAGKLKTSRDDATSSGGKSMDKVHRQIISFASSPSVDLQKEGYSTPDLIGSIVSAMIIHLYTCGEIPTNIFNMYGLQMETTLHVSLGSIELVGARWSLSAQPDRRTATYIDRMPSRKSRRLNTPSKSWATRLPSM